MGILHLSGPLAATPWGCIGPVSEQFELRVDMLDAATLRIAVVPADGLAVPNTWMIAPHATMDNDGPLEGRDRLSADLFDGVNIKLIEGDIHTLESEHWRVEIESSPLRLTALQRVGEVWHKAFEDRPHGAWQWFEKRNVLKHFQLLEPDTAHYGLGDKTGPLDRTGRRLRCLQSDALGYNAETSDPLYKHAPWLIIDGQNGSICGQLYDTMSAITFDVGAEHSNYFPRFRHVEVEERGLVLYALGGEKLGDVVSALHALTGRPAFLPRWAMGFAFTTMHHADAPDAQEVILNFAQTARQKGLPMSAVHLGSGYTAGEEDGLRYVFNWNESRFPNRVVFFEKLKALGLRTAANIKPVLLTGHDQFQNAKANGWFVRGGHGDAAIEMFWGGWGASLDFTQPDTLDFWQEGVSKQVLQAGFDGVWNDNNECELWDEDATIAGFGSPLSAMEMRPIHALLMTRTSIAAQRKAKPHERPYGITRAGPIGIARYGETWSGDNYTSWHTLKWNLRQGLSMSLSGMPFVGHDIGGFAGPPPDAELLVRWFQMMALHPRCVMNSWKVDHDNIPNLPWMHEAVFPHIQQVMRLRYQFLPYLYTLAHRCHTKCEPMIAPLFYHFDDSPCREEQDGFSLGRDVIVAPVVDENASHVRVYLPAVEQGWMLFYSGAHFDGGQWVEVEAPLACLSVFVRCGACLPLAKRWSDHAPHDALDIVPTVFSNNKNATGETVMPFYWDDGLTVKVNDATDMTVRWADGKFGSTDLSGQRVLSAPQWHNAQNEPDIIVTAYSL